MYIKCDKIVCNYFICDTIRSCTAGWESFRAASLHQDHLCLFPLGSLLGDICIPSTLFLQWEASIRQQSLQGFLAGGVCRAKQVVLEGVVFYSEPWKLGCLHSRPDGGWSSMVAPGWGASWSSLTWSGSSWLSGGQSSDTNCDINSCDLEDKSESESMGELTRVSGVLGLKNSE